MENVLLLSRMYPIKLFKSISKETTRRIINDSKSNKFKRGDDE